jgi:uncharacterized Fe-S center protein
MSTVYFADAKVRKLDRDASLPAKFRRLLESLDMGHQLKDKSVMIKMHVGSGIGYTTIHPLFVRLLADYVKECGGRPFITDVCGLDAKRGYTQEVTGCPFYPATGVKDSSFIVREVPEGYGLKELQIGRVVQDADFLITFSHAKGHGNCAYGGAIKNLAMGFLTGKSRTDVHMTVSARPYWQREKCRFCRLCVKNCRCNAITLDKKNGMYIEFHTCYYCMRCVAVCPTGALTLDEGNYISFQRALALSAKTILDLFRGETCHINVILNVTPFCDCLGFSSPSIIPDVGIAASRDVVALEEATLDLMRKQKYIDRSLPGHLKLHSRKGHILQRIWGKNPYIQVMEAEKLGLGDREYTLKEVV